MARIGELLVGAGLLSVEQIAQALRAQVVWGGRIGTNLIELQHVDLDPFSTILGQQHGVPAALARHFEQADPELQERLPPELAERYSCVPLLRVGPRLDQVAITSIEPLGPRARAAIASELMVSPDALVNAVAPELRIFYHLERVYKIPRHARYLRARGKSVPPFPLFPSLVVDDEPDPAIDLDAAGDDAARDDAALDVAAAVDAAIDAAIEQSNLDATIVRPDGEAGEPDEIAVEVEVPGEDATVAELGRVASSADDDDIFDEDEPTRLKTPAQVAAFMREEPSFAGDTSTVVADIADPPSFVAEPPSFGRDPATFSGETPSFSEETSSFGRETSSFTREAGTLDEVVPLATMTAMPQEQRGGRERRRYVRTIADEPSTDSQRQAALGRLQIRRIAKPASDTGAELATLEHATRAIKRAIDRDKVAELVVESVQRFAPRCVAALVLVLRGDTAIGWKGFCRNGQPIGEIAVPLDQPGLVPRVASRVETIRDPLDQLTSVDRLLVEALHGESGELVVVPVTIANQVMCVIAMVTIDEDSTPIETIARAAGAAFARLMRNSSR